MSKSIGKLLGAGTASTGNLSYSNNYLDYLRNYDTSNVDAANRNQAAVANQLSQNLGNRPDYIYSVDGSDAAAQRAEQAMYSQTMSQLEPTFSSRRRELETRMQNQGFSPNSEAYQTALKNLEDSQNNAYINAAQNSILAGQNAFNDSFSNQLSAAQFQNAARQLPLSEIASLLSGQQTGLDIQNLIHTNGKSLEEYKTNVANSNRLAEYNTGNAVLSAVGGFIFSDAELKDNIIPVGKLYNGLNVYLFTYKGDTSPKLGLLAQEVLQIHPEAVAIDKSGYLKVDYALASR